LKTSRVKLNLLLLFSMKLGDQRIYLHCKILIRCGLTKNENPD
jgi:hypothetical protein